MSQLLECRVTLGLGFLPIFFYALDSAGPSPSCPHRTSRPHRRGNSFNGFLSFTMAILCRMVGKPWDSCLFPACPG
jgi:hypothetical protein